MTTEELSEERTAAQSTPDTQDREASPKASQKGRRPSPAERRGRILDAAMRLLRKGNVAPTAAEVAEAAGVSRNLIYTSFKGPDAVIAALAEREKHLMTERLEAAEAESERKNESKDARLRRLIGAWALTFEGQAALIGALLGNETEAPCAFRAVREMQGMLGVRLARVFGAEGSGTVVEELTGSTDFVLRFLRDADGALCADAVTLSAEVCRDTLRRALRKEDLLRFRERRVAGRKAKAAANSAVPQEEHASPGC